MVGRMDLSDSYVEVFVLFIYLRVIRLSEKGEFRSSKEQRRRNVHCRTASRLWTQMKISKRYRTHHGNKRTEKEKNVGAKLKKLMILRSGWSWKQVNQATEKPQAVRDGAQGIFSLLWPASISCDGPCREPFPVAVSRVALTYQDSGEDVAMNTARIFELIQLN